MGRNEGAHHCMALFGLNSGLADLKDIDEIKYVSEELRHLYDAMRPRKKGKPCGKKGKRQKWDYKDIHGDDLVWTGMRPTPKQDDWKWHDALYFSSWNPFANNYLQNSM